MEQLIETCNNLKIVQTRFNPLLDLPDDLYRKHFRGAIVVASNLYTAPERWFATSVTIYKLPHCNNLVAIRSISELYEDAISIPECNYILSFYEVIEEIITTIKYKLKH